jgi:hypothetical protein
MAGEWGGRSATDDKIIMLNPPPVLKYNNQLMMQIQVGEQQHCMGNAATTNDNNVAREM